MTTLRGGGEETKASKVTKTQIRGLFIGPNAIKVANNSPEYNYQYTSMINALYYDIGFTTRFAEVLKTTSGRPSETAEIMKDDPSIHAVMIRFSALFEPKKTKSKPRVPKNAEGPVVPPSDTADSKVEATINVVDETVATTADTISDIALPVNVAAGAVGAARSTSGFFDQVTSALGSGARALGSGAIAVGGAIAKGVSNAAAELGKTVVPTEEQANNVGEVIVNDGGLQAMVPITALVSLIIGPPGYGMIKITGRPATQVLAAVEPVAIRNIMSLYMQSNTEIKSSLERTWTQIYERLYAEQQMEYGAYQRAKQDAELKRQSVKVYKPYSFEYQESQYQNAVKSAEFGTALRDAIKHMTDSEYDVKLNLAWNSTPVPKNQQTTAREEDNTYVPPIPEVISTPPENPTPPENKNPEPENQDDKKGDMQRTIGWVNNWQFLLGSTPSSNYEGNLEISARRLGFTLQDVLNFRSSNNTGPSAFANQDFLRAAIDAWTDPRVSAMKNSFGSLFVVEITRLFNLTPLASSPASEHWIFLFLDAIDIINRGSTPAVGNNNYMAAWPALTNPNNYMRSNAAYLSWIQQYGTAHQIPSMGFYQSSFIPTTTKFDPVTGEQPQGVPSVQGSDAFGGGSAQAQIPAGPGVNPNSSNPLNSLVGGNAIPSMNALDQPTVGSTSALAIITDVMSTIQDITQAPQMDNKDAVINNLEIKIEAPAGTFSEDKDQEMAKTVKGLMHENKYNQDLVKQAAWQHEDIVFRAPTIDGYHEKLRKRKQASSGAPIESDIPLDAERREDWRRTMYGSDPFSSQRTKDIYKENYDKDYAWNTLWHDTREGWQFGIGGPGGQHPFKNMELSERERLQKAGRNPRDVFLPLDPS